jgi:hypothetical protein
MVAHEPSLRGVSYVRIGFNFSDRSNLASRSRRGGGGDGDGGFSTGVRAAGASLARTLSRFYDDDRDVVWLDQYL